MTKEKCKHPYGSWITDIQDGEHGWKCRDCELFISEKELMDFRDEMGVQGDPGAFIEMYIAKKR